MAYGDYRGPDKPDKGKEGGSCNRRSCQCAPALWYNHGSRSWYCSGCKAQIYDDFGQRCWEHDFPDAEHPMFETREMMDKRIAVTRHLTLIYGGDSLMTPAERKKWLLSFEEFRKLGDPET